MPGCVNKVLDIHPLRKRVTPLLLAVSLGYIEMATYLLDNKADPNPRISTKNSKKANGATALHITSVDDNPSMTGLLLNGDGDPTLVDELNQTPLHKAATRGSHLCMWRLIEHESGKAIVDARD